MESPHLPPASPLPRGVLLAMVGLCLLAAGFSQRADAAEVVVLVADRLERADLWEGHGPHLARLRAEAAVGLMCTRFMLSSLPESAYAALGTGAYVQYEGSARWAGGGDSEDAWAFHLAAGERLPPGALYCRERERTRLYANPEAPVGALGQALRAAGKRTACLGNADLPGIPRRQILAILMDERGVVDGGDVGPGTQARDPRAPGGVHLDVPAMLAAFTRVAQRADVVAIEFGDTSRLAALKEELAPVAYERARGAALARLDALVGGLRARIDAEKTLFVLLSPAPPVAPSATEQVLTPIFLVGRGWGRGLLVSPTTRRPGLVANADVGTTLAVVATGRPLPDGVGAPLAVMPAADPGARLAWLDRLTRRVARLRFRVFPAWALLLGPAVAAGPLLVALRALGWGKSAARLAGPARLLQLAALSLPGGALLAAGLTGESLGQYLLSLAGGVTVVACAGRWLALRFRVLPAPGWVAALTAVALVVDTAFGSWRILRCMVSYALTEGARFYGIGNEMMGITVGLVLVALLSAERLPPAALAGAMSLMLGLGIGYSGLGANFGGGLTAACTFATAAVVLSGLRGWPRVAVPLVATAGMAGLLVLLDLARGPEAMSHVGRAAEYAHAGGVPWVAALVLRKAQMNRILIGRHELTRLFFIALPLLLAVSLRLPKGARIRHPGVSSLLLCGVVGSTAAFLLNDSGILAGGLMLTFVVGGAGYLALDPAGEGAACESSR
ncbi:MAG: hypothetical protein GX774_13805 [Armatimonadetes bacterium]|nr:hypothetical protein [Armatimonadota bacterium]